MTVSAPDTSVVSLIRIGEALRVEHVQGRAWHVPESRRESKPLVEGMMVAIGDTVALAPQADVRIGAVALSGGSRGAAYAFVREDAFRPSRSRADVPRILAELEKMRDAQLPSPPTSAVAVASAVDFARANLMPEAANELTPETSRRLRAVCLFVSEETAFVAFESLTVARLRAVIEAIGRPVQPQLVPAGVIAGLFERLYGEPF